MEWIFSDVLAVIGMCGTCLVTGLAAGWKASEMWGRKIVCTASSATAISDERLISSYEKGSALVIDSAPLRSRSGTIVFWVLLNEDGVGIRNLSNNRYLFACVQDHKHPYHGVIGLIIGPTIFKPPQNRVWKLWIKGRSDVEKVWPCPDSTSLGQGWSRVAVRWDIDRLNRMEVLVNEKVIITADELNRYWPQQIGPHLYFGTWPSRDSCHYIETSFAGLSFSPKWEDDAYIRKHSRSGSA